MKTLVVPTIRENSIKEFIENWDLSQWDKLIIVEDNPEKTFQIKTTIPFEHYSWKEIEEDLEENSWIISKRDSACRCYGFLKAYQLGSQWTFTLDDDCFSTRFSHCQEHIKNMENHPKWISLIQGVRTRGLPYFNLGTLSNVVANVGLWSGIPDFDSIQVLSEGGYVTNFQSPEISCIIPHKQIAPLCGMNLAFRTSVSCLFYFPLMGEGYPYRRFDDIFCGIIVKKICDHLNLSISYGTPIVEHKKQSDPLKNLEKETPGIIHNEEFWEIIENIPLTQNSPEGCMIEVAKSLQKHNNNYLSTLGNAMEIWTKLFD